jgi:uncharacterized protein YeaO (DUF488 family)
MVIQLKRAYEPPESDDGFRSWSTGSGCGVSKSAARIDLLAQEIMSAVLRQWFGHDLAKWNTFRARYFGNSRRTAPRSSSSWRMCARTVTPVYGAKDGA